MKRPFLHIFILYSIGIIFFTKFQLNIDLVKILLTLSAGFVVMIFILKKDNDYIKYMILATVFFISIININHKTQKHKLPRFYGEKIKAVGIVKEVVSKEKEYEKYILKIDKAKYNDDVYTIDEKLILAIYENTDIELGDQILTDIEIKEPNINANIPTEDKNIKVLSFTLFILITFCINLKILLLLSIL